MLKNGLSQYGFAEPQFFEVLKAVQMTCDQRGSAAYMYIKLEKNWHA